MRPCKLSSVCKTTGKAVFGVTCWTATGTLVGATGGALYGSLVGALQAVIYGKPWGIVAIGVYFALCGAAAGGLVGGFGRILEGFEESASADHTRNGIQGKNTLDERSVFPGPGAVGEQASCRSLEGAAAKGRFGIVGPSLN
jgi:hypothetical protein